MANNEVPEELINSSSKIARLAEFMMGEDGHDMDVSAIHFTPRNEAGGEGEVVCRFEIVNGERILVCRRV